MTLILDAGPLITLADRRDPIQPQVQRILRQERGPLVLPAPVSAEVDYLLGERLGRVARRAFLSDLAEGRFLVACLDERDYALLHQLDAQYADLDVGLADLSVVLLAHRFGTHRIATFDSRHFRTLRAVDGSRFVLLPDDEQPPASRTAPGR